MWPYCGKNLSIWQCPADRSAVGGERRSQTPRSHHVHERLPGRLGRHGWNWGSVFSDYKIYVKQTELQVPGPAKVFVFLDMREDSIDMGNFATRMAGWPTNPPRYGFYDLPGFYHHFACGFSFADGHSELRRWRDSRTTPPLVEKAALILVLCPRQPRRRLAPGPRHPPQALGACSLDFSLFSPAPLL